MVKDKNLFSEFEEVSDSEWREKVINDLKGKDFEDTLTWKDENEITHQPYYRESDIKEDKRITAIQAAQRTRRGWELLESQVDSNDPIADYLFKGKTSIQIEASDRYDISANYYKEQGSSIIQELSYSILHSIELIDALTENGVSKKEAISKLKFQLAIGNSYFLEIAKFRAFRYLLKYLFHSYDVDSNPYIVGVGSKYYLSHLDMHTNLLRLTTQGMSAVLGGCNALYLPSFDIFNHSSDFGKRMSRNIQLILENESHFDKVIDASSGSYYVEKLTLEIVEKTWTHLRGIEDKGGLIKHVISGDFKKELDIIKQNRLSSFKKGKIMVGVNKFLNPEGLDGGTDSSEILSKEIER